MHTSLEFLADQILVNQINVFLQLRKASVNEDFFFFWQKNYAFGTRMLLDVVGQTIAALPHDHQVT